MVNEARALGRKIRYRPVNSVSDVEAEKRILRAILEYDGHIVTAIESGLCPEDFWREAHGHIYRAMLNSYAQQRSASDVDELTSAIVLLAERNPLYGHFSEQVAEQAYDLIRKKWTPLKAEMDQVQTAAEVIHSLAQARRAMRRVLDPWRK